MSEILFAFDERNYRDCQQGYRGERNQEYYLGDYTIGGGSIIDVRAERRALGSCSIISLHSKTRLRFRRGWSHIQEDATDVVVLWFVRRGRLVITNSEGRYTADPDQFALTRSMQPFTMECETDASDTHEVLHAIVPAHEFRRCLPREVKPGFAIGAGGRELALARRILTELFTAEGEMSARAEQALLDAALALVADGITAHGECFSVKHSLRAQRLEDVLRYIDLHLSDPRLSAAMVASGCGISTRYLSSLLKDNGTPFSEYIWDKRVGEAGRWLATSTPAEISIAEIAFRVGFKSPAHFSRMFKRVFKHGPRDYRAACLEDAARAGVARRGPTAREGAAKRTPSTTLQ